MAEPTKCHESDDRFPLWQRVPSGYRPRNTGRVRLCRTHGIGDPGGDGCGGSGSKVTQPAMTG
jgi:hypothetical protein